MSAARYLCCFFTQRLTHMSDEVSDQIQGRCVSPSGRSGAVLQMFLIYVTPLYFTLEWTRGTLLPLKCIWPTSLQNRESKTCLVSKTLRFDCVLWTYAGRCCFPPHHTWTQTLIYTFCVSDSFGWWIDIGILFYSHQISSIVCAPLTRRSHFALLH